MSPERLRSTRVQRTAVIAPDEPEPREVEIQKPWLKPSLTSGDILFKGVLCLRLAGKGAADLIATHLEIPSRIVVEKNSV